MNSNMINGFYNPNLKEEIEAIDRQIAEEKKSGHADKHKILKLQEQKMIQGLFNANYTYSRFRSPW